MDEEITGEIVLEQSYEIEALRTAAIVHSETAHPAELVLHDADLYLAWLRDVSGGSTHPSKAQDG